MGCFVYFSRKESSKEAGIWIFIISFAVLLMGLFSIYMCTWRTQRFQYSYSKAKVKFQKLYPDYTNLKLSNEIEKNDKKRAIISTLYGITIQYIIWFCDDFLLFCSINNYKFIFIKYLDISCVKYYKKNGRSATGNMHDAVVIRYRENNKWKQLSFNAISPFLFSYMFILKEIEVIGYID